MFVAIFKVFQVAVGCAEVEMALSALWVDFKGFEIGSNRLVQVAKEIVSIAQVVDGCYVRGVVGDGLVIVGNGVGVSLIVAVGVAQVVIAFTLFRVLLQRKFVVLDGVFVVLHHIVRVSDVVMDVRKITWVYLQGLQVEFYRLLNVLLLIEHIAQSYNCL